jgi:RimJ/RimL family protein N-acetyltransferase
MSKTIDPLLQDVPMPILTPRLRIERVGVDYTNPQIEALSESLAEIGQWSEWIHKPDALSASERLKWLREGSADFERRKNLYMVAFERSSGRLIAGTGFHNIDWDIPSFEIGYWVRTSATKRGYATEITTALAHYAFIALGARRVEVCHADGNDASARVIAKSGFTQEGILKNHHRHVDGRIGDTWVYALTDRADLPPLDIIFGADALHG